MRIRGPWPPRTRPAWWPCALVSAWTSKLRSPCRRAASTMPSSVQRISGLEIQAHRFVAFAIVFPALAHLDAQEKMNPALEQFLQLGAGALADTLYLLAALADHDRLLAVAHDMDDLGNLDAAVGEFLPAFGLDGRGIGQLLVQLQEDLLTRNLGGEQALRCVGHLLGRKQPGALRHHAGEIILQILDAVAQQRRQHEDAVEDALGVKRLGQGQQRLALHLVDLVERQQRLSPGRFETCLLYTSPSPRDRQK